MSRPAITMPPVGGQVALPSEERRPQLRHRRDRRDRCVDVGSADIVGVIDLIDQHAPKPAVVVGGELDLVDEGRETVGIRGGNAARERQPGDRAVQEPGVAEPIPDRQRSGGTDAALARRARSIECDDEARAFGGVHRCRIAEG